MVVVDRECLLRERRARDAGGADKDDAVVVDPTCVMVDQETVAMKNFAAAERTDYYSCLKR